MKKSLTPLPNKPFIITTDLLTPNCLENFCEATYFTRILQQKNIFECAKAIGITYQELDALERGECKEFNFTIFLHLFRLYGRKISITVEE